MDFLRPGLKTGVGNGIFWSEIGSGFGDAGGTPHQKFQRVPPPLPGKKNSRKRTHASVTVTVVRDRKIGTALRTNQIVGFVTVPAWGCIKRQRRIECVSESLLEEGDKEALTVLMVRDEEP